MNKWAIIKSILLFIVCLISFFNTSEQIGENPPLFIYPIVSLLIFIGTSMFFKGTSTNKKLTIGAMTSPIKKVFDDPLPFYHLAALAALLFGIFGFTKNVLNGNTINDPLQFFSLATGFGIYLSVLIANKYYIK